MSCRPRPRRSETTCCTTIRISPQPSPPTDKSFLSQPSSVRYCCLPCAVVLPAHGSPPDPAPRTLVRRRATKIPSVNDGDWKVNPDGTMDVTWKLKPNVTSHDGAPLTSADVAFGYQMYLDPELPVQRTGGVELVSDVA